MTQTYSEEALTKSELALELPVVGEEPVDGPKGWFTAQKVLIYFVLGVIVVWLLSGFYQVGVGDVAVVERLGQYVTMPNGHTQLFEPGLNYHLPWPIDKVHIIPLQRAHLLDVSDFHTSPASNLAMKKQILREGGSMRVFNAIYNPYLITGDENVLHATITVQYRINNPVDYLKAVYQSPTQPPKSARFNMIRALAAHVLIRIIAASTVNEALYSGAGKEKLERELYSDANPDAGVQALMNQLGLGIQLKKVQLEYVHWPAAVNHAFNAVLIARQKAATEVQNALQLANHDTTLAQGQAQAILNQAESHANRVVQQATGQMQEFSAIYAQYRKNPRVISLKLLSDALGNVMRSVARVFIVQPNQRLVLTLPAPHRRIIVPTSPLGTAGSR